MQSVRELGNSPARRLQRAVETQRANQQPDPARDPVGGRGGAAGRSCEAPPVTLDCTCATPRTW